MRNGNLMVVNNQNLHIRTGGMVGFVINRGQNKTNKIRVCMFAKNDTKTTNTRYVSK